MSIATDLRSYLLTQSALTTLSSTRMFCHKRDQGSAFPALVLSLESEEHGHHLRAASGWAMARVTIDSVASTYVSAAAIDEQVRQELSGFNGTIGTSSTLVTSVVLDNRAERFMDPIDGSDVGAFVISSDYMVQYAESVPTLST